MNAIVQHGHEFRQSTDAAHMCGAIVKQTASLIQGRKYVSVEGWQAIAIAHGCAAGSRDVEKVEGGVRAIGEVRRMDDGQLIATAEGFVGEDEPTWYGGKNKWGKETPKRPDYAIRAMAQTRAISRACRSAFAHVVVMIDAGLSTTPAEEVPDGGFIDGQFKDTSNPAVEAQDGGLLTGHSQEERRRVEPEQSANPTQREQLEQFIDQGESPIKRWREPESPLSTPSKLAAEMRRLERELAGCGDSDMVYGLTATEEWREFVRIAELHAPHYLRGGDPAPPEFEGLVNTAERLVREFDRETANGVVDMVRAG